MIPIGHCKGALPSKEPIVYEVPLFYSEYPFRAKRRPRHGLAHKKPLRIPAHAKHPVGLLWRDQFGALDPVKEFSECPCFRNLSDKGLAEGSRLG